MMAKDEYYNLVSKIKNIAFYHIEDVEYKDVM